MAKSNQKQVLGRGLSALLNDPKNEIESITNMNSNLVIGNITQYEQIIELSVDANSYKYNLNEIY